MKKSFAIGLILTLTYCSAPQKKSHQNTQSRKIEPILNEVFINKYPNYKANNLVRNKAFSVFVLKFDSLIPLHYMEDIPMKVFRIQKNPYGKGAMVQFYADNFKILEQSDILSNSLEYDVIGFMSEELAATLNENKKYTIFGNNYNRLDEAKTSILVNTTYYSPEPKISENSTFENYYEFQMGIFLCEIDSVRMITKQTYNR